MYPKGLYLNVESVCPIITVPFNIMTVEGKLRYVVCMIIVEVIKIIITHATHSHDEGDCTMMVKLFPVPTSFTAATTTSSASPSLLTL